LVARIPCWRHSAGIAWAINRYEIEPWQAADAIFDALLAIPVFEQVAQRAGLMLHFPVRGCD